MDINIKLSNGQILRGIIESPGEKVRAVIIFVHGLGEHIHRYEHWIKKFNREGIGFIGFDLPGHGRSDGKRGHIRSYRLLSEMLDILISTSRKTFPEIPVFIYGHSLGGGIVLDYLLRSGQEIKGAIVTSPWLLLSFKPDRIRIILARIMKGLIPGLIQPSGLVVSHISHDQVVVEKYLADPLVHNKISVSMIYEANKAAGYSLQQAGKLKVPLLIMHGSDDQITSPEGSRQFSAGTDQAELKIWDGGYHELHNELFKDEVFTYIMKWIEKQK
jgi:alpha-beta hydrolase superfamily lysophospholipase